VKARSVIAGLLAVLVPLALSLLTFDAARAALAPAPAVMAASSPMSGCQQPAHPLPAKAPDCNPACPLVCAPLVAAGAGLAAPIRPYARLHYDQALSGLEGRALEPELPPPRGVRSDD
jgi:hypothetical protein